MRFYIIAKDELSESEFVDLFRVLDAQEGEQQ